MTQQWKSGKRTTQENKNMKINNLNEYWDKIEETPYYKVASKSVMDSDGFWTEYTMYYNEDEDNYFFIFGDSDIYGPDPAYADWECETNDEAVEWYNSYNGFEDEEEDSSDSFELDDEDVDESLEEKLTIDEDLFDIVELPQADPIPDLPVVETESEPSKETPNQGPEFGVSDLLNNLISSNWDLNSSYNELIVNAEANSMNDIADVVKGISADINNHIGKLQAALSTICPSVENISVGEEEAAQQLEPEVPEVNEELSPSEKARLEKRGTVNRKTIDRLNKITSKYNGFHEPQEIRQMWDELSSEGVEVGLISGSGDRAEDGAKSWTVEWSLEGIPVWNSYFIYSFYEPENSTKNDYTIYFS